MEKTAHPEQAIWERLRTREPLLWLNPDAESFKIQCDDLPLTRQDLEETDRRWRLLAPVLARTFPELAPSKGEIDSELIRIPSLQTALGQSGDQFGNYYLKADHDLPVAGSIKARGGLYEVFSHALGLAHERGIGTGGGSGIDLLSPAARELFSTHSISVGSTGNLGLSVGIAARALGFEAVVHMSSDAKMWKVRRLKDLGVRVVLHQSDYTQAVAAARNEAVNDESIHFVDDEQSELLFLGYSTASAHLKRQLDSLRVRVDEENPLFLYLPCGIGGAPGGIAFGAKHLFGDHAHCFFVEPTESPSALVQLSSRSEEPVSVYDVGLGNDTEADGLAVAQMSLFVASMVRNFLSGVMTVRDDDLYRWVYLARRHENLRLEPSATAGFGGPELLIGSVQGQGYISRHNLAGKLADAAHVIWTTGGSKVPDQQFDQFVEQGRLVDRKVTASLDARSLAIASKLSNEPNR